SDFLAAEDADDLIDAGDFLEQVLMLAFGQAAGDDDRADAALLLEGQHFADDTKRFLAGRLDEAAGVDDNDIGAVGVGDERVAVLGELAEHGFGIDGGFRAAEADEGEGAFGVGHGCWCLMEGRHDYLTTWRVETIVAVLRNQRFRCQASAASRAMVMAAASDSASAETGWPRVG